MKSLEIEEEQRINWIPNAEMERRVRENATKVFKLTSRNLRGERIKQIEQQARERVARALRGN